MTQSGKTKGLIAIMMVFKVTKLVWFVLVLTAQIGASPDCARGECS
jgi:hypothetical protein